MKVDSNQQMLEEGHREAVPSDVDGHPDLESGEALAARRHLGMEVAAGHRPMLLEARGQGHPGEVGGHTRTC